MAREYLYKLLSVSRHILKVPFGFCIMPFTFAIYTVPAAVNDTKGIWNSLHRSHPLAYEKVDC